MIISEYLNWDLGFGGQASGINIRVGIRLDIKDPELWLKDFKWVFMRNAVGMLGFRV